MIEPCINEVRLRVRSDHGDPATIRPVAESVMRAALERCAALLEERSPGRLVFIRRLHLNWRIEGSSLENESQVEDLARSAADAIERMAYPPLLDPPSDTQAAMIFDDEAHLRASHLLALARGRPAWFHSDLETPADSDPLAALAAPERRQIAHAVLLRLAREGVLAEVLAARPPSVVAIFAEALGCARNQAPTAESPAAAIQAIAPQLAAIAREWRTLSPAAFSLAARVHAAILLGSAIDAPETLALASAAASLHSTSLSQPEVSLPLPVVQDSAAPGHSDQRPAPPVPAELPQSSPAPSQPLQESAEVLASHSPAEQVTACAALFYLCDRIMELDIAESLWKACLPEGELLAAAAAALLGLRFSGDRAATSFGGTAKESHPQVSIEQHSEIAFNTCQSLATALPRRGLAVIPPATLALVDAPAGRLLVAAAEDSPFAFFAWPAATPRVLSQGLDTFLSAWPHHAALTASPALASLDTSGRLRPSREPFPQNCFIPTAHSAPGAALLALVIGAPCLLFAARVAAGPLKSASTFVDRYLALPGRIRTTTEEIEIVLKGSDLNVSVRRAGLDRDPGWLPWLRRKVRFSFEKEPAGPESGYDQNDIGPLPFRR